jgi:hypothetical protein
MKVIRVYSSEGEVFFPNIKETKEHVRFLVRTLGKEVVRDTFKIELMKVQTDKEGVMGLLRHVPILTPLPGDFYITPRGVLKFDSTP